MDLPRSTRAGRGELRGPAPSARQVRRITVHIEQVGPGVLRVSQPDWVGGVARTAPDLARLVACAFVESQIKAHSDWRGHVYDGVDPDSPPAYRRPKPRVPGERVDVHHPGEWRLDADGRRWVSPGSGRRWSPDSQNVQRVIAKRLKMGLPPTPDPVSDGGRGLLGGKAG